MRVIFGQQPLKSGEFVPPPEFSSWNKRTRVSLFRKWVHKKSLFSCGSVHSLFLMQYCVYTTLARTSLVRRLFRCNDSMGVDRATTTGLTRVRGNQRIETGVSSGRWRHPRGRCRRKDAQSRATVRTSREGAPRIKGDMSRKHTTLSLIYLPTNNCLRRRSCDPSGSRLGTVRYFIFLYSWGI